MTSMYTTPANERPFKNLQVRDDIPPEIRRYILAKLDALHELIKGEVMADIPKVVRVQLNTAWCGTCGRFTGLQNGTCVVCNRRLADELKAKAKQAEDKEELDG